MTLVPAAQCFLKFVNNYLSRNESTLQIQNQTNSNEVLEIFRNSYQDWQKLIPCSMLRSTSLQNFSVSQFHFFSPSPLDEPQVENSCSGKNLIDNHQQTISIMEDSIRMYENNAMYLQNDIQSLREQSVESERLIQELERNNSRLNKLLERKELDLADANKKVQNYHKYYCWSLIQIANLMKEENALRDENINLLLLMEEYCSDNEYCEQKLKEYQEKLNQIEKEMLELSGDIKKKNQNFQEEKNKNYEEMCKLKTENENLKVHCEVQQSEVDKCQQMMELYRKRIDQVKHLVETKSFEISSLEKTITILETKVDQADKDKDTALNELQTEKNKNEELTSMTETLTEKSMHLESSLGEYKTKISTLCEALTSVQEELAHSQGESKQLRLNLNHIEDELNTTKASYESKLKQKVTDIEACMTKAAQIENKYKDELELLKEELGQSKTINESYRTELEMVRTELKCKNELSKVIEDQHHRLNLSYEALYKEFTQTMSELDDTKKELNQLNEAMSKMTQHNQALKQIELSFKTREHTLEQEVQEKLKSFETEILEKDIKIKHLEDITRKYTTQIEQLHRDIQDNNEEIERLKGNLTAVENDQENNMNSKELSDSENREATARESPSMVNAQEILSLLEINSAHCKRYHALEKAYKELSTECSALQQSMSLSPRNNNKSPHRTTSRECNVYENHIRKLTEENRYLQSTLMDYKRINGLLLDQIKVSVNQTSLEDSLPSQTLTTLYDIPEKEDQTSSDSTLSVEDRNTVDLWWENELSIPHNISFDTRPCTETKSL
uniref:Uncharacterized protein n=1 Tax=Cacopsylla melanoneura TaxID=428564 RepID=A0A8D8RP92_9HEMI